MNKTDKQDRSLSPLYSWILLGMIFAAALIIRIYPVIASPEKNNNGLGIYGDSYLYHVIAYNIYKGHGFSGSNAGKAFGIGNSDKELRYEPAITRGPVYPFFISMVYKFSRGAKNAEPKETLRKNWDNVRIAQCVLDSFVCVLVFFLARLIYPRLYWPALISAVLYCFSFYNIYYMRALLSESVSAFMLTLSILFCVLSLSHKELYWWALAGAGLGLTALTRAEYIFFPFILVICISLSNKRQLVCSVKKSATLVLAFFVIISPWLIRNYIVFRRPVPIATGSFGYSLYLGTIETNTNWRGWGELPASPLVSEEERAKIKSMYISYINATLSGGAGTKRYEDFFMKLGLDNIRRHPIVCLKTWIIRIPCLWYQSYVPIYPYREASGWFFIFYFTLALYALYKSTGNERLLMRPVCLLFIYITVLFLPFHIEPRYGVSLMPAIICLAGIGCYHLLYYLIDVTALNMLK